LSSNDLFKKKRAERKKRGFEYKQPRANSYLIVTEGEKTEPLYFKGLQKLVKEKMGGNIDVYEVPLIDIEGVGRGTSALLRKAEELVSRAKIIYQNVWIVFDKDDFRDFDQAIYEGERKGYKVAWSNESFEYWLFLHFEYSDAALHRKEWNKRLGNIFRQRGMGNGTYRKNYENIYRIVDQYDGVSQALKHARRRMDEFHSSKCKPSEYSPGTTVYLLVEELRRFLDE